MGDIKIIWKVTNANSCLNLPGGGVCSSNTWINNNCCITLIMTCAEFIETSVTITDNLLSQLLGSTLTWKIKLRRPKVVLCLNYSLNPTKWIM